MGGKLIGSDCVVNVVLVSFCANHILARICTMGVGGIREITPEVAIFHWMLLQRRAALG